MTSLNPIDTPNGAPDADDSESFEALFEQFSEVPDEQIRPGDRITGRIIQFGDEDAFVAFGGRHEGYLPIAELLDAKGHLTVDVGDEIQVWISRISSEGIQLSRGLKLKSNDAKQALREAFESRVPVEGTVKAVNKGGFDVEIGGIQAFCPRGRIDTQFTEEADGYIGLKGRFLIIDYGESGRRIVVSRRDLLEQEAREKAEELKKHLRPGIDLDGTVTRLARFGAFVDIGGIEGLVPLREMSHAHIESPSDLVAPGQTVRVRVLSVDLDDRGRDRIALSMKSLTAAPWESALPFSEGQELQGKVLRIEAFGAFVELAPGLEGLLHISEISNERISHPSRVLSLKQLVQVRIVEIDRARRRIALSMKTPVKESEPVQEKIDVPGIETEGGSGRFGLLGKLLRNVKLDESGK